MHHPSVATDFQRIVIYFPIGPRYTAMDNKHEECDKKTGETGPTSVNVRLWIFPPSRLKTSCCPLNTLHPKDWNGWCTARGTFTNTNNNWSLRRMREIRNKRKTLTQSPSNEGLDSWNTALPEFLQAPGGSSEEILLTTRAFVTEQANDPAVRKLAKL